jgi:hypothetical protein
MKRLGLVLVVGSMVAGCATQVPPPVAPQAPAPLTIDTRELSEVRAKIADFKAPPADPVLRRYRKEELVNKTPTVHASDPFLKAASKDVRVSVLAVGDDGKFENADPASRAVADALCLELLRKRINLVDQSDPQKTAATGRAGTEYVIFVNRATDNREAAKPQFINLPWYVPEPVWNEYRQKRLEYQQSQLRYREQVENYNLTLQRIVRQAAETLQNDARWKEYEDRYRQYEARYADYMTQSRAARESVPPKAARVTERYRVIAPLVKPALEQTAAPKSDGLEQQILADLSKFNFVPYEGKLETPMFLDDPSEVIGRMQGRNTDELVTIHQFAMSVRVVDAKDSKAVWYGYAESQNLTYINALKDCCEAIVDSLVSKASADGR